MSRDDQGTKCFRNVAENLNRLSRVHERYRRQTDGRATVYSEHEYEFTFAKNLLNEKEPEPSLVDSMSISISCPLCNHEAKIQTKFHINRCNVSSMSGKANKNSL